MFKAYLEAKHPPCLEQRWMLSILLLTNDALLNNLGTSSKLASTKF